MSDPAGDGLTAAPQRRALRVRGAVQGVGFRPFVYRLALQLQLRGWVCNDSAGVLVEVQGPAEVLDDFTRRLRSDAPPLARVEQITSSPQAPLAEETALGEADGPASPAGFAILPSRGGAVSTAIPPDTATCGDCLAELFDPADRRHRYGFINCTQCGPRWTISRSLPYDRAMTSMAVFPLCPACRREYTDPTHRRFHAEPNACPVCGPRLNLVGPQGQPLTGPDEDAIAATLARLLAGEIVAIKGLGGFHLACDARNAAAVAELRRRKARDEKPFALMCAGAASARRWVRLDTRAQALLEGPERAVVLLPANDPLPESLPGVAPGLPDLGLMLPCTPIQFLLFHEAAGRPCGTGWLDEPQDLLLVMTSANPGGEPLVRDNDEALRRLQGLADAWLLHDRDIVARCDDSVLRARPAQPPQFIRRARGWTPVPIRLPRSGPPVLAVGAWLKNTICITRGDQAFLSPHIGSLDNAATCEALVEMVDHLCAVLDVQPQVLAHDLHPDFFSTRFALQWAQQHGLPPEACWPVQHHHAHIAAVAAEHGCTGPLLGLALDGVGLGDDGQAWGGELLRVDGARCHRIGHLAPLALPGGDIAAREPWRMAAAALQAAGLGAQITTRFGHRAAAGPVAALLSRGLRCPPTSSAGRWFDAAAGLLGLREVAAFEGQAAMLLEALAAGATDTADDADEASTTAAGARRPARGLASASGPAWRPAATDCVTLSADGVLDPGPLLAALAAVTDPAQAHHAARFFHEALADGLVRWVLQAARQTGLGTVALGGGCFLNQQLCNLLVPPLASQGLRVLQARQAPPNDGAIALGQAWVALSRF